MYKKNNFRLLKSFFNFIKINYQFISKTTDTLDLTFISPSCTGELADMSALDFIYIALFIFLVSIYVLFVFTLTTFTIFLPNVNAITFSFYGLHLKYGFT